MRKLYLVLFLLFCLAGYDYASSDPVAQAFIEKDNQWTAFRNHFRYHIQLIALKKYDDSSVNIILSEPPNRIKQADIESIIKPHNASLEIKQWQIGVDGFVKDVVISVQGLSLFQLNNLLAELHQTLFLTSYKATFLNLDKLPSNFPLYNLNYQVTASELNKWFLADKETFYPAGNNNKSLSVRDIIASKAYGEFFSYHRAFVLWVLPSGQNIDNYQKVIRQFALDADLVIGAIYGNNTLVVIGRKRKETVYALPPLRVESVLMLAAANKTELGQSYERTSFFAGKMTNEKDWAPIYLSRELINTEYGSLLNITDQMLKSWSQKGRIKYENFPYPYPGGWPYPKTMFDEIGTSSLTYNWNTKGVGYSVNSASYQIYAVNRTGSLPVSYFPDSSVVNLNLAKYEEGAYQYFSGLNDPNLVRVGQYTFLYQIFKAFNVIGTCNNLNQLQQSRDVLTEPTVALLKKIMRSYAASITRLSSETNTNESISLISNLLVYYRLYGDEGLREIARLANDREAISQTDKIYFRFIRLCREEEALIKLYNHYGDSCNRYVDRFNELGKNIYRTDIQEAELNTLRPKDAGCHLLIDPIQADLKKMKIEIDKQLIVADARLSLKTKILQQISLASALTDLDEQLCDSVQMLYAQAHATVNNTSWIKTPSIVISQDTLDAYVEGGHNIDASIEHFLLDASIPKGRINEANVNGNRVLKINPADLGRINSSFLKDIRYANSRTAATTAKKDLQRSFSNNPPPPPRNVDEVIGVLEPDGSGYDPKQNIGWAYEEKAKTSKALAISRTEDGYFMINNRKTTTCYNIREAIEDHLKNQPDAEVIFEFDKFSPEEIEYYRQHIASRFTNREKDAGSFWKVFKVKSEAITARIYDFDKTTIHQLENGIIRLTIPKKVTDLAMLIDLVGVAKNMFQKAKSSVQKIMVAGKAKPDDDIVANLVKEFKAAGIPLRKVIVSIDDCSFCIHIQCIMEKDNKGKS